MEVDLKKAMENLRDVTCELIDKLQKDDYDALEGIIDKRQKLLNDLEKMHCTIEQYGSPVKQFEIIAFQNKLSKMMFEKKKDLREKIDDISKRKASTKGYYKHIGTNIFSKKI
ncbi:MULTISPECIES: hypothetical protein [Clostridium]|nr:MULTISPECIES: hypothetical protein [Clostridium]AGY77260.1 hypothetical protein CAETHG_3057 [Clostridium autoethanogenum DSM 10061]ALU37402.1 Hypothetical protein CLAU_2975 [Clostridium autoethanogenum DSM 10061]OAA87521.1 hypothetical protein WX45_03641 [Clostridium ljungdahlii DSM 13528]OVY50030.1 hypothetical protein WX72_02790 [Clostridium autoethanogenum]